jgi:hypothetical protein
MKSIPTIVALLMLTGGVAVAQTTPGSMAAPGTPSVLPGSSPPDASTIGRGMGVNPSNSQDLTNRNNSQDLTAPRGNNSQDRSNQRPGPPSIRGFGR